MPDLEELFKGKPYLEALLKGRRWARVKRESGRRIDTRMKRTKKLT